MDDEIFGLEDAKPRTQGFSSKWVLPMLVVLGILIYEVTSQPGIGVAVLCLKFGWEDFRTGFWLRRADPERRRGSACFWLFMSLGMLKTAITGSILMFVFVFAFVPRGANPPPEQFVAAAVTAMSGFLLCTIATGVALFKAWRGRIRLWVSGCVHQARRENAWPALFARNGEANQARAVVLTALITIAIPLLLILIFLLMPVGQGHPTFFTVAFVFVLIFVAFFVLAFREYVLRGFARHPAECWDLPGWRHSFVVDQK
jgi:hypothetical protein